MAGEEITRLTNADEDLSESKDLSSQHPELVERMKAAFARWSEEMEPQRKAPADRRVTTKYNRDEIEWHI